VVTDVVGPLGPTLVEACGVHAGHRVLDVAAGNGNAALPAAATGARVTASDLTPELLEAGRRLADERGLDVEWQQADAEALPFPDAAFDVVVSCLGVMFAPHHRAAADELLRVCRPGGTIGLLSWTPQGLVGQMFATMKPYVPPAPPGVEPAPSWGDEDHVRGLLGEAVTDLELRRRTLTVDRFGAPEEFRDFFKATYGPVIAAYRGIADDAARVEALDADLVRLAERFRREEAGRAVTDWEYLLVTARRR
jgi:SAM-dependent methyltransferase